MGQAKQKIIVAGGGIGGVSAAMGLANMGYEVTVLEQAPEFGEIGAGIQIGPNAFHAMDYLGVGDTGRAKAVCAECPVRQDCLEFALTVREKEGVWGGLTAVERQRLVRRRRRQRRAALASTG